MGIIIKSDEILCHHCRSAALRLAQPKDGDKEGGPKPPKPEDEDWGDYDEDYDFDGDKPDDWEKDEKDGEKKGGKKGKKGPKPDGEKEDEDDDKSEWSDE